MDGQTPVHVAAYSSTVAVLDRLVSAGRDLQVHDNARRWSHIGLEAESACVCVCRRGMDGRTPVHVAAYSSTVAVLDRLVSAGRDLQVHDSAIRWSHIG